MNQDIVLNNSLNKRTLTITSMFQKIFILICFIAISIAICFLAPSRLLAFPDLPADQWLDLNPDSPTLITSQSSITYDPRDNLVFMWGGHPPGGGYPQVEELFVYDIEQNRWRVEHPISDRPPGYCVSSDTVYDESNNVFVKLGSFLYGTHQWMRNFYLKDKLHLYDPLSKKWTIMRSTYTPNIKSAHGAVYDTDNQVIILYGGQNATTLGTWAYDLYTNTWTKMLSYKKSPPPRDFPGLAYDREHKKTVLFGGGYGQRDTWIYDIHKNSWLKMKPSKAPPASVGGSKKTHIGPSVTYDSVNKKVLAFVPLRDKGVVETWAYDLGTNIWTQKSSKPNTNTLVAHRGGDIVSTFLSKYNAVLLINLGASTNCLDKSCVCSETMAYRYDIPENDATIDPPTNLSSNVSSTKVTLTWQPSHSQDVIGYNVYRGIGEKPWQVSYEKINIDPIKNPSYIDTQGINGENIYFYFVRAIDSEGMESIDSLKVRTQPRIIKEAVVSVLKIDQVEIHWQASPETDIAGYNIYRAKCKPGICAQGEKPPYENFICPRAMVYYGFNPGKFSKLNTTPYTQTTYTDNVNLEGSGSYPFKVYAYIIKAVNRLGIESGPSPYWPTIPSAPVQLKFKEEGDKVHLKWAANPEKKIKGYRVYRKGPAYEYPMSELTTAPIQTTSFTDFNYGGGSHVTYYITAIDCLGQDGIASARALTHRTYRSQWDQYHYLDGQYLDAPDTDASNADASATTTNLLPPGSKDIFYGQQLFEGGMSPYIWSISPGHLPPGLSLSSDGFLSGIPTQTGSFTFTISIPFKIEVTD